MAAEALVDIQRILTKHKIFSNVTTWYEDGKAITKIILKDSTARQLNHPETTNSDSGIPKESCKTKKSKKNPSKMRRDAKSRDAYVAKKTSDVSSKAAEGNAFSSTFLTPQRRASLSGNNDIPDSVGDSPIPQLDGGENFLDQDGKINLKEDLNADEVSFHRIDTGEFMRQFKEALNEFELNQKNKAIHNDEDEHNDDDQIEDATRWARSQKKLQ